MNEREVENELQAKGLNAPRLTPELIDAQILAVRYIIGNQVPVDFSQDNSGGGQVSENGLACLTVCILVLRNGFTVVGKSACASPENFNAELGRKIAYKDARDQIWMLEGYVLKTRLSETKKGVAP